MMSLGFSTKMIASGTPRRLTCRCDRIRTMAVVEDILVAIDRHAPWELVAPWDNVGLIVGERTQRVSRIGVEVELTQRLLDEHLGGDVDCILVHHPPIFKEGLKRLRPRDVAVRAAKAGVAVIAAHTNADFARGGLAWKLAETIGLERIQRLSSLVQSAAVKVVTFVPSDDVERVRAAMFDAGAGIIGAYERCSFSLSGTGMFTATDVAKPTLGDHGAGTTVEEVRIEVRVQDGRLGRVLSALFANHPYEEPVVDIYPFAAESLGSIGVWGSAPGAVSASMFAASAASASADDATIYGDPDRDIRSVAVVPGSGKSALVDALDRGCDAFVTGELGHHERLQAIEDGMIVIELGHVESERVFVEWARSILRPLAVNGEITVITIGGSSYNRSVIREAGETDARPNA